MTFNTGNPIGSTDARDRSDNSESLDLAVNSLSQTFVDRLGVTRDTLEGIYQKSAYYRVGTFEAGYTLTNNRQTLAYGNIEYSWSGSFPKVVAAGATPATTGGIGAGLWTDKTDLMLRADLTFPVDMSPEKKIGYRAHLLNIAELAAGSWNDGDVITTDYRVSVFDKGGAIYVIDNSLTPDGYGIIQTKNGAAKNIAQVLTLPMFGADPSDTYESSSSINAAFAFAKANNKMFREDFDACYKISSGVVLPAPVSFYGKPTEGELKTGTVFHWVGNSDTSDAFFAQPATNYKDNMREVANIAVYTENTQASGLEVDGKCRSLFRFDGGHGTFRNIRTTSNNLADSFLGNPSALIGIWGYKAYSYDFTGHNYAHGCAIGFLSNDIDITSASISNLYVQNNLACFVAFAPVGMSIGALSAEGANVRWRVVAGNHTSTFMAGLNIAGLYGYGNSTVIQKGIYIRRDITACLLDVNTQVGGRLQTALAAAGSTTSFTPNTAIPSGISINGICQGDIDVEDVIRYVPNVFQVSGGSVLNIPTLQQLLSFSNNGTITPKFMGYSADKGVKSAGANNGYLEKHISNSAVAGEFILGTFSLTATNAKQVVIFGELLVSGSGDSVALPKRFTAALTTPAGVVTVSLIGETSSDIHIRVQGGSDVLTSAGTTATGDTSTVYEVYIPSISRAVSGRIVGFKPTTSATCSVAGSVI